MSAFPTGLIALLGQTSGSSQAANVLRWRGSTVRKSSYETAQTRMDRAIPRQSSFTWPAPE
jgi:hypothetical protein